MKYFFPDWMFLQGTNSSCYNSTMNAQISAEDQAGARRIYPFDPPAIKESLDLHKQALRELSVGLKRQIENSARLNTMLQDRLQ